MVKTLSTRRLALLPSSASCVRSFTARPLTVPATVGDVRTHLHRHRDGLLGEVDLEGTVLDVVRRVKNDVVVRHPDSATMRLPRAWTDVGAVTRSPKIAPDTQVTIMSLRELVHLVDLIGDRV